MRAASPALLVLGVLLSAAASAAGSPQSAQAVVRPTEQIKTGFKTYSLFLICNPGWLHPSSGTPQTKWLYQSFQDFGRAIGDDNLAVWFWRSPEKQEGFAADPDNVDVERSARFCRAWHLTPSAGPHLVVTSTYPDERNLAAAQPQQSAVFALGNMADSQISSLLSKLTDQLLLSGKVGNVESASGTATNQDPSPLWVRLLGAVQKTINNFGCAWTFKIDAGAVKADLHSCSTRPE